MNTHVDPQSMTQAELLAAFAALQVKVAAQAEAAKAKLTLKVSAKGAVALYGMGRFPVTLYAQQWERVCEHAPTIRAFIAEHKDALSFKS